MPKTRRGVFKSFVPTVTTNHSIKKDFDLILAQNPRPSKKMKEPVHLFLLLKLQLRLK
jgi:hypothetical protein